jgi:hypothetical protein
MQSDELHPPNSQADQKSQRPQSRPQSLAYPATLTAWQRGLAALVVRQSLISEFQTCTVSLDSGFGSNSL